MNGVTSGVAGILPRGTTTFSHTSTTVRRRSTAGSGGTVSSWCRAPADGSLDEEDEGAAGDRSVEQLACALDADEGSRTVARAGNGISDDVLEIELAAVV